MSADRSGSATRGDPARRAPGAPRLVAAAGLALAGALETAWLTHAWLARGHVPCVASERLNCMALFVATGSSPLGLPLVVWGHAAYALATVLALAGLLLEPPAARRARVALAVLATGMAGTSAFLVARMVLLSALCPWCLLSAGLSLSLGALAVGDVVARTVRPPALVWGALLAAGMGALVLGSGAPAAAPSGPQRPPATLAALARHLRSSGAHLYGVWWCVGCREQRELFGDADSLLPYVECSREPAPAGIREYPTWEIAGRRLTGVQPLDTLAARSGFALP